MADVHIGHDAIRIKLQADNKMKGTFQCALNEECKVSKAWSMYREKESNVLRWKWIYAMQRNT